MGVPKSSGERSGWRHASHSTAKTELKGASQAGQRWSVAPPHAGQRSGSSDSNSSNQRCAAPQLETDGRPVAEHLAALLAEPVGSLAHGSQL